MSFTRRTVLSNTDFGGSQTVFTIPLYNQAAGDLLVLGVKWEAGGNVTVTSVADIANGAFTSRPRAANTTNNQFAQFFYITSSAASAVNVITVTFSGTATYIDLELFRYSHTGTVAFVASASLDNTGNNTDTPATGTFTAGNVAVCACANWAGVTGTQGTGWTMQIDNGAAGGSLFEDRIDSPGGTINGTMLLATPTEWEITAISFSDTSGSAITGTGALTLPAITSSGAGTVHHTGTGAATLPPITSSGAGTVHHTGTGAATLPAITAAGSGSVNGSSSNITGTGALTLPPLTSSGAGKRGIHDAGGTVALTLPAFTVSGVGIVSGPQTISGSGALTLPPITASGAGTVHHTGTGAIALPTITASGSGRIPLHLTGTGALTLPQLTVNGTNSTEVFVSGGTAYSSNGTMQTVFLTDGTPVPAGAVYANGIAHSVGGFRYVALWPGSGVVSYNRGLACRTDGAMCIDPAGVIVARLLGMGVTFRGEVVVSANAPEVITSGLGLQNSGALSVSDQS